MKPLFFIFVLIIVPTLFAEDACEEDRNELCASAAKEEGNAVHCLKRNYESLTRGCQVQVGGSAPLTESEIPLTTQEAIATRNEDSESSVLEFNSQPSLFLWDEEPSLDGNTPALLAPVENEEH